VLVITGASGILSDGSFCFDYDWAGKGVSMAAFSGTVYSCLRV
jgi:hypothetical protein